MAFSSLQGQLLIAAPALVDPNFHRSVVLMLEHEEEGAIGVVLNRPSAVDAAEVVPPLEPIVAAPERIFSGGPVQPGAAIALGEYADPTSAEALLAGNVGVVDLDEEPDALLGRVAGPARGRARGGGVVHRAGASRRSLQRRSRRALGARARAQGRRVPPCGAHALGSELELVDRRVTSLVFWPAKGE
jgi:hypothetical protein